MRGRKRERKREGERYRDARAPLLAKFHGRK